MHFSRVSSFGKTCGRFFLISSRASSILIEWKRQRYRMMLVGERPTPAVQWMYVMPSRSMLFARISLTAMNCSVSIPKSPMLTCWYDKPSFLIVYCRSAMSILRYSFSDGSYRSIMLLHPSCFKYSMSIVSLI